MSLTFQTVTFDVVTHNNQPYIKSEQLAKALGYAHSNAVTKIFNRNKEEFTAEMSPIPNLGFGKQEARSRSSETDDIPF